MRGARVRADTNLLRVAMGRLLDVDYELRGCLEFILPQCCSVLVTWCSLTPRVYSGAQLVF